MSLKTIETLDRRPFKHFCATIGELPTSFIDSMSYYELLAWFCQYLEKTVIPTINENAEAVTELQDLFVELKAYVDDYFNNLDIQEEINNKLDEMAESGELEAIVSSFLIHNFNSVKSYGALGDGVTDDTEAIVQALNELPDGGKLYFPAGDYIVYSDYTPTTTNPSYPTEKLLKLVEKKNIVLYGDGVASRIRPPRQGIAEAKVYHPCILTIDKCENIEIYGLTIEGKGESYGDADAGTSVPQNERQSFVMHNGGSAILVSGSKNINIHDSYFRLCGSCGVVYHSDVSDCIVKNCFANSASYGYAGFAIDTFCYNSPTFNQTIIYDSCVVHKETLYQPEDSSVAIGKDEVSGKSGICTEGSATNMLNVTINNCTLKDAKANQSNNYREGEAVILQITNGNVTNNVFEDNDGGVYCSDINSNQTPFNVNILGNIIKSNWFGVTHRAQGSSLKNNIIVKNNSFYNKSETVPEEAQPSIKSNPTISVVGYSSANIELENNYSEGSKYFFNATHHIGIVNMYGNIVKCEKFLYSFGGGDFTIKNNKVTTTATSSIESVAYLSTVDGNNTVGYLLIDMSENVFNTAFVSNHLRIVENRLDLFTKREIGVNKISQGWISNQSIMNRFKGMLPLTCTAKDTPTSTYSKITFSFEGGVMPFVLPCIQDANGTFHKCENYVSYNANNGTVQYYVVDNTAQDAFVIGQSYMGIFTKNPS